MIKELQSIVVCVILTEVHFGRPAAYQRQDEHFTPQVIFPFDPYVRQVDPQLKQSFVHVQSAPE